MDIKKVEKPSISINRVDNLVSAYQVVNDIYKNG